MDFDQFDFGPPRFYSTADPEPIVLSNEALATAIRQLAHDRTVMAGEGHVNRFGTGIRLTFADDVIPNRHDYGL